MTSIEQKLKENGDEFKALTNLRHAHTPQNLVDWLTSYDTSFIPCVIDEDAFAELRYKALELEELADKCYAQIREGYQAIEAAFTENRSRQKELQAVRDIFK